MKNDKILYFGNFEATTPSAQRIIALNSNEKFDVFKPSVVYGCSLDDALEITKASCSWPLEVAFSRAGELHPLDFQPAKTPKQVRALAMKAKEGDIEGEIILRKPASLYEVSDHAANGFVILGNDFVSYTFDGEVSTFSLDNGVFFAEYGLDNDLAYRFGHNGGYFYFDNIISRSNPIFDDVICSDGFFKSIPKTGKKRAALKAEYVHGFQIGFTGSNYLTLPYGIEKFSDATNAAYTLGGLVGSFFYKLLAKHATHGIPNLDLTQASSWDNLSAQASALNHMVSDSMKKRISDISIVHAAMIGKNPKDVDIDDCMTRSVTSVSTNAINAFGTDFYRIQRFYNRRADIFNKEAAVKAASQINFTDLEGISLNKEVTISKGQVRTSGENKDQLTLRLQLWDFTLKSTLSTDGASETIADKAHGSIEKDLNVNAEDIAPFYGTFAEYAAKFKSLNHSELSQAGTQVKYVPIELAEDGLRAKEDGSMLIPMQCLLNIYDKSGDQFQTILNLIKKTAKK